MSSKIRVAVVGYGNVGKSALQAVHGAADMELAGVVRRKAQGEFPPELTGIQVVDDISKLADVKAALLCVPTRSVPAYAAEILARGIHTVDSYDIHGELADLRQNLDQIAKQAGSVAIISAGWDPGTDSMLRAMLEFMAPQGLTYTKSRPRSRATRTLCTMRPRWCRSRTSTS